MPPKLSNLGAGVVLNSLLIYVIRTHTKLKLGAYKHLLTIFASFDLFLIILHGFVEPVRCKRFNKIQFSHLQTVVIVGHTFGVVSQGFVQNRVWILSQLCFTLKYSVQIRSVD